MVHLCILKTWKKYWKYYMGFRPHEDTRKCHLCKDTKKPQAFVGERVVCRLCWLDVPEKDKSQYLQSVAKVAYLKKLRLARANDPRKLCNLPTYAS